MGFRLLDQNPVYFNNDGTVCAGGEIRVYANLTTTPENAGEGEDLTPSLGSTITLDASGRAEDDIWIDTGPVRVRLYDADGVMQWSRDYVQDGESGGVTVPDPSTGDEDDVLSTDGVAYLFRAIREVPDPTGNSGKYVGTDGTAVSWTAFPAAVVYDEDNLPGGITTTAGSMIRVGNEVLLRGTGTCPTSATTASTVSVAFGYTFASAPQVWCTPSVGPVTSESARCSMQALSASTTGFTASAFAGAEDGGGALNISTAVTFSWMAWGTAP